MKTIELEVCNRCNLNRSDELLHDLAYSEDRYIHDLVKKAREEPESPLAQEALKQLSQRLDDREDEGEEESEGLFSEPNQEDGDAPGVPGRNEIQEEDILNALKEHEENGLVDIKDNKVIVTSRGVKKLAAEALQRILRSLQHRNSGVHREKPELGVELSLRTRRYEAGDDYSLVDLEKTALNALKRCGRFKFEPDDFEIHEEEHRAKLCAGIIIDESGSMRDSGKL
ncbi:MAG: hypothetical protein JSU58_11220, partial [Dehalococcoidales bacterium]